MSQSPYPKSFVEMNEVMECSHLMNVSKISDGVIEANIYSRMFIGCPSISFETVIERPEPQVISKPEKFDNFDWDRDFSDAYENT